MNQSEQQKNIQKILATSEGRQLLKLLSGDGGAAMRSAGEAIRQGDTRTAQSIMAPLVDNPEVQKLLKALEKTIGHG